MFRVYNFINIFALITAGLISSLYFYVIGKPFTNYITAASAVFFIFFILILILTGNIRRKKFSFFENKTFLIGEIVILAVPVVFALLYRGLDYWNAAGIFLLGLIIVFDSLSTRENVIRFIFLIISPLFYTGLILKHGLFTEVIFFFSFLFLTERFLSVTKSKINYAITAASLGLIMLFNPYLILAYVIFFFFHFKTKSISKGVLFASVTALTYLFLNWCLTVSLAPIVMAPELYYFIPAILISAYLGFIVRNTREVAFAASILILISVLLKFIAADYRTGVLLLSSVYPMLIMSIGDYRSDKWIGKILED